MKDESEADDGALHEFNALTPEEAEELAPFAGDSDPGKGQRERE